MIFKQSNEQSIEIDESPDDSINIPVNALAPGKGMDPNQVFKLLELLERTKKRYDDSRTFGEFFEGYSDGLGWAIEAVKTFSR